jgi:hypothetical protein
MRHRQRESSSGPPAESARSPSEPCIADPISSSWASGCTAPTRSGGTPAFSQVSNASAWVATSDATELLEARPDYVIYAASGPERDAAAFPDYVRIVEAGINVVTVTSSSLIFPDAHELEAIAPLMNAAMLGDASLYASGIEPGFAADHLPLVQDNGSWTRWSLPTPTWCGSSRSAT